MLRVLTIGSLMSAGLAALAVPTASAQVRTVRRPALPPVLREALDDGRLQAVDSGGASTVSARTAEVTLPPGRFLVARLEETPRLVVRRRAHGMVEPIGGARPESLLFLPIRGYGTAKDGSLLDFQPVLIVESPMRYQRDEGLFSGSLLIGLEDRMEPARPKQLSGPIHMMIASDGDSTAPRQLTFDHTNLPLLKVSVFTREPSDSVRVRFASDANLRGVDVWLPVRAAIVVPNAPRHIAGLGLETVRVPITIRGGLPRDSVTVTLATDRGSLEHQQLVIGRDGSRIAKLRSQGVGAARITATSPGINGAETIVEFRWPVPFVLAALSGGAIGAAVAEANARPRRRRAKSIARTIVAGTLIGFVVSVVYFALGVMLLAVQVTVPNFNEAAVFALALLGGMLGIPALATVAARRRPAGATVPAQ